MLVVNADELTAAVEFQVEVVGEFHFVATALLIYLRDMGAWEATLYLLGDGSWNVIWQNWMKCKIENYGKLRFTKIHKGTGTILRWLETGTFRDATRSENKSLDMVHIPSDKRPGT